MLLFSQKPWHEQVLRTTNIEELNYRQKELSISIKGRHSTRHCRKETLRTPPPAYTPWRPLPYFFLPARQGKMEANRPSTDSQSSWQELGPGVGGEEVAASKGSGFLNPRPSMRRGDQKTKDFKRVSRTRTRTRAAGRGWGRRPTSRRSSGAPESASRSISRGR